MRSRLVVLSLAFSISLVPIGAHAQWQLDGVPLCTVASDQVYPTIVSDGAAGAIVTWVDYRNGTADIYAQRVNASGAPQWTANGVALCTAASDQSSPTIVSDGAAGAIVTWEDPRSGNFDIYAQRVNAFGAPQWTANGVALCTAASTQLSPTIVSDGAAGAIVTWYDLRIGTNYDIYAQRVNASGAPQWTANGVALCTAASDQVYPTIVSDGAAGAIVTWSDFRSGTNYDIYAQRVNASGAPQWTANGVALCTAANGQSNPTIISDGAAGAIVTWEDPRSGNFDIYAQRVNAFGAPQWTANGVALCTAASTQLSPTIVSDGAAGAIVTWYDLRIGTNYDIYAQRVNASGAPQWTANGVALCTAASDQVYPTIVSDGAAGAIVTWSDFRSGTNYDIYAQRVNASGAPQWTANGVALCTAANGQSNPTIISDGAAGAIVTWYDFRSGPNADIYAQRVEGRYGYWGRPEATLTAARDNPSDQGGKVILNWTASGRDVVNEQLISKYTIWRAMDTAPAASSLSADGVTVVDAPVTKSIPASNRVFWHDRTATTDYYWELVGSQIAYYNAAYSFTASTRQDSTLSNTATHYFRVAAEANSQFYNWPSNVLSAHSVDNLAPAAPLLLTAQRVGANVNLHWNRVHVPDVKDYSVYRKTSAGVTPVPINFLSTSDDTLLTDTSAPTSALYYIVTAYDVHANQSAPSNEAHVSATTGIGDTPSIAALTVLDNMPNPFNDKTTLRVGLPKASDVEIDVFDVAGRSVRIEHTAQLAAGWRDVAFDARDAAGQALPSGVYFYRVKAAGQTITRKMVIAR